MLTTWGRSKLYMLTLFPRGYRFRPTPGEIKEGVVLGSMLLKLTIFRKNNSIQPFIKISLLYLNMYGNNSQPPLLKLK